jgi:TatA/E family protein of Tat protein translocase
MLDLSPIKLLVIVAVILVVLGPDKLPETAHQIGSAWRALRKWRERIEQEVREVVPDLPSTTDLARLARSPVNLLNSLADRVTDSEDEKSGPTLIREKSDDVSTDWADNLDQSPEPSESRLTWSVPPIGDPSLN